MKTMEKSTVKYWMKPEEKLMFKVVSPTEVFLLQVLGRDMNGPFSHRHEKVTYPSEKRLAEETTHMLSGYAQDWEELMNEYLQVNKEKLALMSEYRQRLYNEGRLALAIFWAVIPKIPFN
jgi:hypothetical protein